MEYLTDIKELKMDSVLDISRQRLILEDTHKVVSVELVQHQRVQLQLETDDARETIKAELFTTDCGDDFPCPRLAHSVLHTDSQSYITLSVHPEEPDERFILVTVGLLCVLSCILLTWIVRKWIRWKSRHLANLLFTTTMTETSKADNYIEVHSENRRKFECLKCSRQVTTKHLIEKHLHTLHGLSPLKRVKKLYLVDADIPVPKRTLYRWKSSKETKGPATPDFATHQEFLPSECPASDISLTADGPFQSEISEVDEELSDISDTASNGSDSSANSTSSDTCDNSISDSTHVNALKILSCFQKHKLTASACKDILKTLKSVSASDSQSLYDYNHLLSFVPSSSYKEVHYCAKCNRTFPDDKAVYRCLTENCPGLRYVGDLSQQEDSNQAVKYFMVADVKTLLSNLLKSPDHTGNTKAKENLSGAKEADFTDSKEILCSQDVSVPKDQRPSEASFTMTMIKSFQASSRVRWMLFASILIFVCILGILLTFWTPGFHQNQNTPILKLTFPRDKHIRHIRSYTQDPSIKDIKINNQNQGASLLTRLQLLDLAPDCRNNLTRCRAHALCDTDSLDDGNLKCRCNRGYFLRDLECTACQTSCNEGFYMEKQCSTTRDVVCRPCTQCEGSLYEVAACTTTQDTICIDVSFPLKQFPARDISYKDLVSWNVTVSKNVFLERLQNMKKLDMSLQLLSNKQALEFIWRRSGLEINMKASGIYLIPEYIDIDHIDDEEYVEKGSKYPQDLKDQLKIIREEHCRSPLADEYDLNLEIAKDDATVALEYTCNSKNPIIPACPDGYNDGDKYIFQFLDRPCPKMTSARNTIFSKSPNNIICSGNSEILKSIFSMEVDDPAFLNFPSEDCEKSRKECGRCLTRDACDRGSNETDCCNIGCHQETDCKRYFSLQCPDTPIECSRGDITKFSIMPRYQSITKQFTCHLRHKPPKYFYQLSYEVTVPSMQFSLGTRYKDVLYRNFSDLQNSTDSADFVRMTHHTESKYDDEVILIGSFKNSDPRRIDEYTIHKLKDSHSFDRYPGYNLIHKGLNRFRTKVQFETPYLYSTANWWEDDCSKNVSKIYPSQPIYQNYGRSVKLRNKIKKVDQRDNDKYNFTYQILSHTQLATPELKFLIPENTSILSYYKDAYSSVRINPWNLKGTMHWDTDTHHWNVTVSGSLTACPGIFNIEIYTANLESHLASYDMLINCPNEFSTSFEIERNSVDFVDIFVVVMNDSVSSYRIVLSSIQGPQYFKAEANTVVTIDTGETPPWIPMIVILTVCFCVSVFLIMIYLYCNKKKSKFIPTDISVPKPDLGPQITLLQSMDKVKKDKGMSLHTKFIMMTLVVLYISYAVMFTFTALFVLFHLVQGPSLTKVTLATNTSEQVQHQMQRILDTIIQHENREMDRLLNLTEQRLTACSSHMKSSLSLSIPNGNHELLKLLQNIFHKNGTVNQKVADYFYDRQTFYQKEIDRFIDEFNRTLDTKLHIIQIQYASYLKSVAENTWFTFPKEIFMQQQILGGRPMRKISDNLTGFLTWLEIDKVQELFEMKDIIMNRLLRRMPKVDFISLLNNTEGFDQAPINLDFKTSENTFRFSSNIPEQTTALNFDNQYIRSDVDTNKLASRQNKFHISNIKGVIYPVFICVFLVLDSLLLIYRFSWMVKCLKTFKTGLEERVPCDSMTRKIYFILTGKEVPRQDDSLDHPYDYYMHNKENIWGENTELYFLYCNAPAKAKEEILKDIWQHKQRQNPRPVMKPSNNNCCVETVARFVKLIYRLLISPVFWRLVVICGFILVLFLVAKATNDLITIESAMFLLDTGAMLPIIERQNAVTNAVIWEYGSYLNDFLAGYKEKIDGEVQMINSILLNVAERQNMLLNNMISDMCNLMGVDTWAIDTCPQGSYLVTASLTSCNFLPVHSKMFEGFQKSTLIEYIQKELSPLVLNLRSIFFSSIYLLLTCAAAMLVCQIIARVIFIRLKNSRHMKMTKIYQLPSMCDNWQDQQSLREKEMYNSQSVIAESCESGVYDMTN